MTGDGWERFARPDTWHMPAAYWFWHHLPDEAQIRRQVGEMQAAGIHSFQVQARMAFPLEGYLTDEYLAACRIAVDEAAKRGMMVGVYDDYNWQTGHAAGRAVAGHDHLRERQLFWTTGVARQGRLEVEVSGIRSATEHLGPAGMAWQYEGSVVEWADWQVDFAIADDGAEARDIRADARLLRSTIDGCAVAIDGLADGTRVTVFVSARCATSRLVNFLDPVAAAAEGRGAWVDYESWPWFGVPTAGATFDWSHDYGPIDWPRFVETGYQPFQDALGEYFGSTITYFFFDQPHANYYRWAEHHGNLTSAMPYHSGLGVAIRERWPDRYPEVLRALIDGEDPGRKSLRAQFYEFFSQRSMAIFLGAMHDWTSERGV